MINIVSLFVRRIRSCFFVVLCNQENTREMWQGFRNSVIRKKDRKKMKESGRTLNVNDEYLCAVRTKSYADFFLKVQLMVNNPSSSRTNIFHGAGLAEIILQPGQETITQVLDQSALVSTKSSLDLKSLMLNYFDTSAEASKFCSQLLEILSEIRADHGFINQVIMDSITHYSSNQLSFIASELQQHSCAILKDPFSYMSKQDFDHIHERHSSVVQHLKSKRKRVARKIKLIKYFNKASGVCATIACGVVAAAAMFLAVHTLTALLMGPAVLLSLPMKPLKKKIVNLGFLKSSFGSLRRTLGLLDVAAKGAYILNRDFDTMSRLVGRLQDDIERNKTMIQFCLEKREDYRLCFQVLKELKQSELGFKKQVEELEEHVYLCLVTINRARAMVIKEICQ
ncbi:UPF0496 protein At1g20180-like [Henckelia pumila]|uniref:UPF0496 protein At1g20180-like n=1 Tax=Henckelia pumila TaxID=405737 RepID=UPI003C6E6268